MKIRVSYTIEENLAKWYKDTYIDNVSRAVEEAMLKNKSENRDLIAELDIIFNEEARVLERKEFIYKEVEKLFDEGNKYQRQQAAEVLRRRKEERELKLSSARKIYNNLKEHRLWDRFLLELNEIKVEQKGKRFVIITKWSKLFSEELDEAVSFQDLMFISENLNTLGGNYGR